MADWAARTTAVVLSIPRVIRVLWLKPPVVRGPEDGGGTVGGLSPAPPVEDVVDPPPSADALDCCTGALTCWPLLPPSEAAAEGAGGLTWPPPLLGAGAAAAPPTPALGLGADPPEADPAEPPPPNPPEPPDPAAPPAPIPAA